MNTPPTALPLPPSLTLLCWPLAISQAGQAYASLSDLTWLLPHSSSSFPKIYMSWSFISFNVIYLVSPSLSHLLEIPSPVPSSTFPMLLILFHFFPQTLISFKHNIGAVVVQLSSCVWLFATPWTSTHQTSLSFTISWSLLKLTILSLTYSDDCLPARM